jgi:hypothetical protein
MQACGHASRCEISPTARGEKQPEGTSADWLRVMRAHRIRYQRRNVMAASTGRTSSASMSWELQDGITDSPRSFRGASSRATRRWKIIPHCTPTRYLRVWRSRLYLDNFPHIQASWFSEGKKVGQIALHFGADDFGGTLQEENVHAAANFVNTTDTEECIRMIHDAGFVAAQRNTVYEILNVYPPPAEAA